MTNLSERTGIDFRANHLSVASVLYSSGRPVVSDLKSIAIGTTVVGELFPHLSIGVPDSCVVAKHIRIPEFLTVEPKAAAQQELSLSLLDPPKDYLHDLIPTDSATRWLGLALKRECAEDLNQRVISGGLGTGDSVQFCPRSVALGRAIMTFAIGSWDDYFVAVEIDESAATLCFLQRGKIVDVGICPFSAVNWSDPVNVDVVVRDIRTVIALHQSRLFALGLTTPLTQIALCGSQASERCRISFERYFSGTLSLLRLNAGYFANPAQASEPNAHRYLVPLGLALE
jgi:hypothetical protein